MSKTGKKRGGQGWLFWYIPLLLAGLGVFIAILINGKNIALFNPKGLVAKEQLDLLLFTSAILILVAVPTVLIIYYMAWKYRESNEKAVHDPKVRRGKFFEMTIWGIPSVVVVVLLLAMYPATHRLEPRKIIASDKDPITIQVVSMRWKWLFLYPEQHIASVNFVQIPEDTPVIFELTADEAPMSSFWIPNLGGQLYSMPGHLNKLNLLAEEVGNYPGSSAEINGAGFAGMKFTARVSTEDEFARWVDATKQSTETLDTEAYEKLVRPSENNPSALYANYQDGLYDSILAKYSGTHATHASDEATNEHEGH